VYKNEHLRSNLNQSFDKEHQIAILKVSKLVLHFSQVPKMNFVRSLFVVVVTYVVTASTKDQSPEVFDVLNNYRRDIESPRQIVTMSLILPDRETVTHFTTVVSTVPQTFSLPTRQTVMQLTTLTSTITCTKSVANKCVRQRPSSNQRPTTRPTRPAAVSPALSVPASAVEM
jgi:hypothetical protein